MLALTSLACVDPKKTFGEFGDRVTDASLPPDASDVDAGGGGLFDVTGTFLLSIATTQPVPVSPLRLIVTSEFTATGDTGVADFSVRLLAVEACAAGMGGQPVGETLEIADLAISASGTFDVTAAQAAVPGEANPLACGLPILADLQLVGSLRSADHFCGTVGGMVFQPIEGPLVGTFGAVRVDEPVMTGDANLPAAVTTCLADEVSDAGPEADAGADASS